MTLAINGGEPVRTAPFKRQNTIGNREIRAVVEVMRSGVLSDYLASWGDKFLGGPQVRALEEEWADQFGAKHAVAMNSATSGLYAAVGAAGIGPGDEVIVTPYSMVASATAAVVWGAVPVFADIDPDTFCIDPHSITDRITEKTRAIIAVDLFGHPAEYETINAIARGYGLVVIEDAAQAMGALQKEYGHMQVYSLNYHKHIHTGEGGVVCTDDDELARRLRFIRNHGEVCVSDAGYDDPNLYGFNFRMGEMEAAIARHQLKKLPMFVHARQENADYLTRNLKDIPCIVPPIVRPGCTHAYYLYAVKWDHPEVHRNKFTEAVRAEGVPLQGQYVRPIYWEPLFEKYNPHDCPVVKNMYFDELMYTPVVAGTIKDQQDFVKAVQKVIDNLDEI